MGRIARKGVERKTKLGRHRWVVGRSFAWTARFRRLARDYERLPETLEGLHFLAFTIVLLAHFVAIMARSA
jgi:transposase